MAGQEEGKKKTKVSVGLLRAGGEMENEEEGADEGCRGEEGSVLGPGRRWRRRRRRQAENFGMQAHSSPSDKAAIWATCPTRHSGRFILVWGAVQTTLRGPKHIITHRFKQF